MEHQNWGSDDSTTFAAASGYSGVKVDIFALGVIFFILHFGVPPFNFAAWEDRLFKLLCFKSNSSDKKAGLRFFLKGHPSTKELLLQNKIDYDLMDVITTLLAEDPKNRPGSIAEVRAHPYLAKE